MMESDEFSPSSASSFLPSRNRKPRQRKRVREIIENESIVERRSPLESVVACLSGFTHEKKNELHRLITEMGGTYTRELNVDKNTHLITEVMRGAKFDLAKSNPQSICIVTPSWLYAAADQGVRPSENEFQVDSSSAVQNHYTIMSQSYSHFSLLLDTALNTNRNDQLQRNNLFKSHQFYLLGFDSEEQAEESNSNALIKQKLGKLIRRSNGTIYWDLNEDVTMLILCDGCDTSLVQAAEIVSKYHPNLIPVVSPLWVVESYQRASLQPTKLYHSVVSTAPSIGEETDNKTPTMATTTSNLSVFRGSLFAFLRTSVDQDDLNNKVQVLDFDVREQMGVVRAHGGQILSLQLVNALKSDSKSPTTASNQRKCYVVCWGGGNPRVDTNSLLSRVQRDKLCDILLVTPLWIQTCVTVGKRVLPERVPLVLMPQSWSMKSFHSRLDKINTKKDHCQRGLVISLTGFQGTEKAAIIHLIGAMGGLYHDHMSKTNTHLICKEAARGIKLEKAKQWGLHVVSIQWLYHVLEYGYGGFHGENDGCELRFGAVEELS